MDSLPLNDGLLPAPKKPSSSSETRVATIIGGRGRVGKTVVANAIVQFCQKNGANLRIWNGDRQNETHNLNIFHSETARPLSDDPEEKRLWLETCFDHQARERFDSILDMAGGDPVIRHLAKEARLLRTLERRGIKTVSWQVLGAEIADLDYLKLSMDGGLFMPEATLLVLNTGLVRSGRSVEAAFGEVTAHPIFMEALSRGALSVWFPALICMSALSDRGLTFDQAMRGFVKDGQEPLTFFDQSRAEIFWEDAVPEFFSQIPADWLPTMPRWVR